jgi:hypothetical protein
MKKSMVALVLGIVALSLSSCSIYTCPTYSKAEKKQPSVEKVKI